MELKKSVKADLERRKPTFFQIGLLGSLLIVFLAFELVGSREKVDKLFDSGPAYIDEDQTEITEEKKEELPQQSEEQQTSLIEVVKNDVEVADIHIDAEFIESEVTQEITYVEEVKGEKIVEEEIFEVVEELPGFVGGEAARMQFLKEHTVYPRAAKEAGIQGTVTVSFVVEPDGSISNVKILRSVTGLDEEAIRVTKAMPKWSPGKQRGRAVRTRHIMPIKFMLSE